MFSAGLKQIIAGYLERYETKRSAILPVLHAVQDELGHISDEAIENLDQEFGLDRVQVREVVTFYSMYRTEKPKTFAVYFCDNMVCMMMGSRPAIKKIESRIEAYQSAGKEVPFSVLPVPCLGVCDGAPAMLVNKDRHLHVTDQNVDQILDQYAPL